MARKAEETRSYQAGINHFALLCRNIEAAGLGMAFKSENPMDNGVWYRVHHGASFKSYGEKITITLTPTVSGTDVNIVSECGMPTQLVDGGKNKQNVQEIFRYLESQPVQGQTAVFSNAAPAPGPAPVPTQAAQPASASGVAAQPAPAPEQNIQQTSAPVQSAQEAVTQASADISGATGPAADTPPQDHIFCVRCGKKNPWSARFCSGCGSEIMRF